jgi:hypothetical protein
MLRWISNAVTSSATPKMYLRRKETAPSRDPSPWPGNDSHAPYKQANPTPATNPLYRLCLNSVTTSAARLRLIYTQQQLPQGTPYISRTTFQVGDRPLEHTHTPYLNLPPF